MVILNEARSVCDFEGDLISIGIGNETLQVYF